MYDRKVLEPRMVAGWSPAALGDLPPSLEAMRRGSPNTTGSTSTRCPSTCTGTAPTGSPGTPTRPEGDADPLVATVSLGARRPFLLRPAVGSRRGRYEPGGGDLIVMGGATQHDWHRTVPREQSGAGARMSVTMRHSREGWWV